MNNEYNDFINGFDEDIVDLMLKDKFMLCYKSFNAKPKPLLPEQYQRLQYIESTGTQKIKTNYTHKKNTEFETVLVLKHNTATFPAIHLARTGGKSSVGLYAETSSNSFRFGIGEAAYTFGKFEEDKKYKVVVSNKHCTQYDDKGNILYNSEGKDFGNGSESTTLFCDSRGSVEYGIFRLYSFIVRENGIINGNFVPCYKKSNGEAGVYDTKTRRFLNNSGTGEFIKGPEVVID